MKLATRLIMEDALEAESRDALGRDYYEHGAVQVEADAKGGPRIHLGGGDAAAGDACGLARDLHEGRR